MQIHVYKRYCSKRYSKIAVDATGSVVKPFIKFSGEKTKPILLYECTVGDAATGSQYPIANMLSEAYNSLVIYVLLASWLRSGAIVPQEVVLDMSLALIYAAIMAFTSFKTLNEYLRHCNNACFLGSDFNPGCFIGNDVAAHTMKLISERPRFKNQHNLTRRFYLKSIGQLMQCTSIEDAQNIIEALFTVALSDTEGLNRNGVATTCETRKIWLKKRVAAFFNCQMMPKYLTKKAMTDLLI